jgi:acetyltransferase-like isoleucine patch superfamily enzyme
MKPGTGEAREGLVNGWILKIKRAETPFYRGLKKVLVALMSPSSPRVPEFLKPLGRGLYELHYLAIGVFRWVRMVFYIHPLFQSRCTSVGKNLKLEGGMPFVSGHGDLIIGDDVHIGGRVSIISGRVFDRPRLVIQSRSLIGWNTTFSLNREIVVEEDVMISFDCRISDNDGHPRDALLRAEHKPPAPRDVRPVRICRYAWIGNGTHIAKGVTVGEGAIIGANSVVLSNIPPYSIALGNPAEVYFRNINRKQRTPEGAATQPSDAPR